MSVFDSLTGAYSSEDFKARKLPLPGKHTQPLLECTIPEGRVHGGGNTTIFADAAVNKIDPMTQWTQPEVCVQPSPESSDSTSFPRTESKGTSRK